MDPVSFRHVNRSDIGDVSAEKVFPLKLRQKWGKKHASQAASLKDHWFPVTNPHCHGICNVRKKSNGCQQETGNCPEGMLQLGICRMHPLLAQSFCGWAFFQIFSLTQNNCSCLMASGVGIVEHFTDSRFCVTDTGKTKHFRQNPAVSSTTLNIRQVSHMCPSPKQEAIQPSDAPRTVETLSKVYQVSSSFLHDYPADLQDVPPGHPHLWCGFLCYPVGKFQSICLNESDQYFSSVRLLNVKTNNSCVFCPRLVVSF